MYPDNRVREAFDSVRADEKLKTSTREFLQKIRHQRRSIYLFSFFRVSHSAFRWAAGAVCTILLAVLGVGGYTLLWTPFSYVSIDVNPSLELILNRFDRVISVESYNEDGEEIMEGISVGGMYYTDAIEQIVESDAMQPYLTGDTALTFTVAAGSSRKEEGLLSGIEQVPGCVEHGGMGARTDMDIVEEAHINGFSLGKYAAYKILQQYDDSLTADDCHDMTMSEIHHLIEQHEHREHGEHGGYSSDGFEDSSVSGEGSDSGTYNGSASGEGSDSGVYNNSTSGEEPDSGTYNDSGSKENAGSGKGSDRGMEEDSSIDESQNNGGGTAGGTRHHTEGGNGHGSGHGVWHD